MTNTHDQLIRKTFQPNILVISGGGPKGIAFIGALIAFKEKTTFDINNVKILSGSSIGGVISAAICFGYTLIEIKQWFLSIDFSELCPVLYNDNYNQKVLPLLYKSFSLSTGEEIKKILCKILLNKGFDPDTLTFNDLYKKTNKLLILTGSNLNNKKCDYFSNDDTPNMKIIEALLITTRIPYIFPPIKHNEIMYVDGHLFNPFPIKGCGKANIRSNKNKIIGLISLPVVNETKIENIKDFTFSIIEGISYQYIKKSIDKYKKYIIPIELKSSFFNLKTTIPEINKIFTTGFNAGELYIKNI